jgi:acyl-CoA dehydrogenase
LRAARGSEQHITKSLYPLSFDAGSLTAGTADYLQEPSIRLLVDFFQNKGLAALKQEDREEVWYQDWVDYQAKNGLYASLLSPKKYSNRGHRFSLRRLTRLFETFAYFGPAQAYSLHVSFLGLFPILVGANETLKKEAISKLESGGLFAFGVSEKTHGADVFANEMTVISRADGSLVAEGAKYYIGNSNAACMISILGKKVEAVSASATKRAPFVFYTLRPSESSAYRSVRKLHTIGIRTAFVGAFEVKGHPLPPGDIISDGRDAWEALHGTINFGKYFLGLGSVGMCEHAFAEALVHMRGRVLYCKPITEMPHIRATTAVAFGRLMAMKLYAYRALDYLQASSHDDRRYLLFNPVQKAKVSTEGVLVIHLLSECIGARGFESETYFESALRETLLVPSLEGSTHINFGLTTHFIDNYFFAGAEEVPTVKSVNMQEDDPDENPYWWEARDRNAKTVWFAPYLRAYDPFRVVPNVEMFLEQVQAFAVFVAGGIASLNPSLDAGLLIGIGKCFSTIVYAQLVAENCAIAEVALSTVSVMFHGMIEDLSAEALKLSSMFSHGSIQRTQLKHVVQVPNTIIDDLESVSKFIAERYAVKL